MSHQHTPASRMSSFYWQGQPSIFASDKQFTGLKSGKTFSQTSSESVQKQADKNGRSPGTISGLSANTTAKVRVANHARRDGK